MKNYSYNWWNYSYYSLNYSYNFILYAAADKRTDAISDLRLCLFWNSLNLRDFKNRDNGTCRSS